MMNAKNSSSVTGRLSLGLVLLFLCCVASSGWAQIPQTLSYQGVLTDANGNPVADGEVSIVFRLHDAEVAGSQLWEEKQTVTVVNGIFNVILGKEVPLDIPFDRPFWLEIELSEDGVILQPRVELTASAYSLNARAVADSVVTGVKIADGSAVRSINGLTDVVALEGGTNVTITPDGQSLVISATGGNGEPTDGWALTGNSDTDPAVNFLGTTDSVALELRVENQRTLRIEPNSSGPNLIGGMFTNDVTVVGVAGATISGGGTENSPNTVTGSYATIGGGLDNTANGLSTIAGGVANSTGGAAAIGGGQFNEASGTESTVSGGRDNTASGNQSTVGGGIENRANGDRATIGGGSSNMASAFATVGGGSQNTASDGNATVGGGLLNTASGSNATVSGGFSNTASGLSATVGGGSSNTASFSEATVGGGSSNTASGRFATIAGGSGNEASATNATVSGGGGNLASGILATVPGGQNNHARGNYSFAAGFEARAIHDGSFVWNDRSVTSGADSLVTTGENQFLIRAAGGVGIGTNNPTEQLHVNGTALADAHTTPSSRRWKSNIRNIDNALEKVQRLRGVTYNWKEGGKPDIGLIAEEVGEVVPEVVVYEENGVDAKSVDYSRLVALLIEGMKEQQAQITALQEKLAEIQNQSSHNVIF